MHKAKLEIICVEQVLKWNLQCKPLSKINETTKEFIKQYHAEGMTVQSLAEGIAIQSSTAGSAMKVLTL